MELECKAARSSSYLLLRKKPPKSKKGMISGGPMARAMDMLVLIHEIR